MLSPLLELPGEFNFLDSTAYDEDITLPFVAAASWWRTSF